MEFSKIKQKLLSVADEGADWIKNMAKEVYNTPELGFKEEKTSALVQRAFSQLGMEFKFPLAVTGVKATLKGKNSKYNVCLIGELDSIFCAEHPDAKENGAVHACGHSAQIGALLGAAYILKNSGIMCAEITFRTACAADAIEYAAKNYPDMEIGAGTVINGEQCEAAL